MDYTQNPFLKDDNVYYSEVADIRDDINALATDISQININLTDDIRNVDERLNAYQNSIKQNVFTNRLEANVADINTASIDDINAKNVKTNVLDVNILNVASINNTILANPHIENMDAVNGQILNAEIKDSVIINGIGSFDSINTNTINIESGSIKRTNIADSTLTNVVINGFDLNNPRYLNANNADFNVANFKNIYGVNADFDYIQRVNTDNIRTTSLIVNGDATLHYLNANNANIGNIINTNISNATLYGVKVEGDLVLPNSLIVNDINANTVKVEDLNATTIAVQELTDVNLIHANNVSSDWGYIQNLGVHNLTLDVSKEPKETPYVLGYDTNGNIFPAIAQGGGGGSISLPADSDYIYTDAQGLPLKGTVAADLSDTNALVKAGLVATLSEQTNEQVNTLTNQVNTLSDQLNEITDALSILNELKPNTTADYFNSASPLDYKSITAFEKGKANKSDKASYTVVADGILGFTGIKVDNNTLHFDSTLNNFYLNKDLSYMFNGCSNFDGTGFDAIPEGTTNTAYMFAYTALKKPYKLPASVIDSNNMYENITFETTPGEDIDGINNVTYNINSNTALDLNITNSQDVSFLVSRENSNVNNTKLNITNSGVGFATSFTDASAPDVVFNGGDIYLDNVSISPLGTVKNANVTLKGSISSAYSTNAARFFVSEINAVEIESWNFPKLISGGNVHIGENTPVKEMFGGNVWWGGANVFPNIIYPENRTSWAGLYYNANNYNMAFLNEILPNATNVDEMFYSSYNNNLFNNKNNILNVLNVLNKNITSLYKFCDGPISGKSSSYAYGSLSELKAAFPNVKNIGYSHLVWKGGAYTEDEIAGFTDISGLYIRLPAGTTTFNVPTLTTLDDVFDSEVNNVNIVISNNCTFAPNVSNDYGNRFLTGDLSGIKNGYYLYKGAKQWHGYPENLETAQYMYAQAQFAGEIGAPLPAGLTNTSRMFNACLNITSMPGVMDLSNCKDASDMFYYCPNLTTVDFNFLKTLKPGSTIAGMFSNCPNLVCNDINVFTYIPEGVNADSWFGGMLVSDVNTNNESIISTLSGLNVAGNVDVSFSLPSFRINVLSLNVTSIEDLKSLNISINTETLPNNYLGYRLNASKYNLSIKGGTLQEINVYNLGSGVIDSYFEVSNCKNIQFDGGESSRVENSRFVFRNIDNACINGSYSYGGPMVLMYNSTIELNNINFFNLNIMSADNIHLNQMPINGFRLSSVIVDSAASIDTLDRSSYLYNASFIDNRLNINTLANILNIDGFYNVTDIYLNSVAASGKFSGESSNVIIHIPTNAVLAAGLNNGTYGISFPNENIIQY